MLLSCNDSFDIQHILGAMCDCLENDQVFGRGQPKANSAYLMFYASFHRFYFEWQQAQGNIHTDAGCYMLKEHHPVATGKLDDVGKPRLQSYCPS